MAKKTRFRYAVKKVLINLTKCRLCIIIYMHLFIKTKHMKKAIQHLDTQTPHKDRLLLVVLFAVFAFTVLLDLTIIAEDALVHLS